MAGRLRWGSVSLIPGSWGHMLRDDRVDRQAIMFASRRFVRRSWFPVAGGKWEAFLVEANPQFTKELKALEENFPDQATGSPELWKSLTGLKISRNRPTRFNIQTWNRIKPEKD